MKPRLKRRHPVDVPQLLERLEVAAKRSGTKLVGACPIAPSNPRAFVIRDDADKRWHGYSKCQSCGFTGSARELVEAVLGLNREEAEAWLEDLSLPRPVPGRVELVDRPPARREGVRMPAGFVPWRGTLEWPTRCVGWPDRAVEYLVRRRVDIHQIVRWGPGVVPKDAVDADGEPARLRGRIVIPCLDRDRRVLSYTARAYIARDPKYLTPQLEEGPSPAAIWGEHLWFDRERAVVTEGAFNALAAERVLPDEWAVASLGGSEPAVPAVLKLIRFKTVVVATDGDEAGKKAWRLLRDMLGGKVELRRACPPGNLDLDDMAEDERREFLAPSLR